MSGYENIVGGKLKLKGKALDVKAGGVKKKKKKQMKLSDQTSQVTGTELSTVGDEGGAVTDGNSQEDVKSSGSGEGKEAETEAGGGVGGGSYIDSMTAAERRYMEQRQKIDIHKLAKTANKSHRDRIEDFNQYLANMSEHYDIPKVGPG
ncbi:hypothetical protein LguiA_010136 [Lonicera macranthoides]